MIITPQYAKIINNGLLILGPILGLFNTNPKLYFLTFLQMFIFVFGIVIFLCLLVQFLGKNYGRKIQDLPSPCMQEFIISIKSAYIAALMMSWPVTALKLNQINNFVWNIMDSSAKDSILGNIILIFGIMLFDDVYQYMLHRMLHLPFFFILHQTHHFFFNPSAYSVLALSPGETFFHFLPVLFNLIPSNNNGVVLWIPLFLIYYISRFLQGVYMHSGYTFDWVEKILPKLFLTTSYHHNLHHSKGNINFAEFFTLLDLIFNDGLTPYNKTAFQKKYYKIEEAKENKKLK